MRLELVTIQHHHECHNTITITYYYGSDAIVTVPSSTNGYPVTSIGDMAFILCFNLTSVILPDSITNIGNEVFVSDYNLTSMTIPNSVTNIGRAAFEGCYGLTNVVIGTNVISIGTEAFEDCWYLRKVTIFNSVTSIGTNAFYNCTNLHQAYFQGSAPSVNGGAGSADNTVFSNETGTVYYLPNTTGWGATFGSWPAMLWNPQMQTTNGNFGIRTNRFGFNLTGTAGNPVVVEACTNLGGTWTTLFSGTVTNGSIYFSDRQWTNYSRRFYRVRTP